jgi:hypothetical protein
MRAKKSFALSATSASWARALWACKNKKAVRANILMLQLQRLTSMLSQAATTMALLLFSPVQPYVSFPSVIFMNSLPSFSKVALFPGSLRVATVLCRSVWPMDKDGREFRTVNLGHRPRECYLRITDRNRMVLLEVANPTDAPFLQDSVKQLFVCNNGTEGLGTGSDLH